MGEVYRAEDLRLGQPVALELLRRPRADAPRRARQVYDRSAAGARTIAHPNVCRVFDIGEAEDWHYLSMEYINSETLVWGAASASGACHAEKAL